MRSINLKKNISLVSFKNQNQQNQYLCKELIKLLRLSGKRNLILSGGNSLRSFIASERRQRILRQFKIYISDERLVSINSNKSNYFILRKENSEVCLNDIYAGLRNKKRIIKKNIEEISSIIPKIRTLSACFLGVGNDGHVASIFKNNFFFKYKDKNFSVIKKNNEEFNRASFSLEYLSKSPNLYFIINNNKKKYLIKNLKVYKKYKNENIFYNLLFNTRQKVNILTIDKLIK